MNLTELWYQIADMSKSDKVFATIAGVSLSESQVLWLAGIIIIIVIILLIRAFVGWLIGNASPRNAKNRGVVYANRPTEEKVAPEQKPNDTKKEAGTETPHDLLADTSERKRSLYDYVTPDAIHADVMKQTLNNDFPYVTLKPNPNLVAPGQKPAEQVEPPKPQPVTPAPLPQLESVAQILEQQNEPVLVSRGTLPTTPLATAAQPTMPAVLQQSQQQNTQGVPVLQTQPELPQTPTATNVQPIQVPTITTSPKPPEEKSLTAVEFAKMPATSIQMTQPTPVTTSQPVMVKPTVLPPLTNVQNLQNSSQQKVPEQQQPVAPIPSPISPAQAMPLTPVTTITQPPVPQQPVTPIPVQSPVPVQTQPQQPPMPEIPVTPTQATGVEAIPTLPSTTTPPSQVQSAPQSQQPVSPTPTPSMQNSGPYSPTNPLLP